MSRHELDDVTPLSWRVADFADLDELFEFLRGIWEFDRSAQRWSFEEFQEIYRLRAGRDELILGRATGSLVACGWTSIGEPAEGSMPIRLAGAVHPAYRHQHIGRKLLNWQIRVGRSRFLSEAEPGSLLQFLAHAEEDALPRRALYRHAGLVETRWLTDLICPLEPSGPARDNPWEERLKGVRILPFGPKYSESTRQAHNETFGSAWKARPISAEEWAAQLGYSQSRPEWSWLAVSEDTGQVVGYALNSTSLAEDDVLVGWTDRLGVRSGWRGRGIARVLLARSLESFREAGMERGGLGVDSAAKTDAALYRSVGYEPTDTMIQYELTETFDEVLTQSKQKGTDL